MDSWTFGTDVKLAGTWQTLNLITPAGESFFVGIHDAGPRIAGVVIYWDGNSYVLQLVTANATTIPPSGINFGGFYDDATGATEFRIQAQVNGNGTLCATVKTLDGSAPGTTGNLGCISITAPNNIGSPVSFQASFLSFNPKSLARARVICFVTSAVPDALALYSRDPYAKADGLDQVQFCLVQANLGTNVIGYQSFHSSPCNQSLVILTPFTEYYKPPFCFACFQGANPYNSPILDPAGVVSPLDLSATSIPLNPNQANTYIGRLPFTNLIEEACRVLIDPNNGAGSNTAFVKADLSELIANRLDSNIAVYDSTPPTLTNLSVTQDGGPNLCGGGTASKGPGKSILICVEVKDNGPGGIGAGLDCFPEATVDFYPPGPGPEDIVRHMHAGEDNTFCIEVELVCLTLSGQATVTVTASDKAGNLNSTSCNFIVKDTEPPNITCPPNQTRSADASCHYTLEDFTGSATVSDNCDPSVTVTQSPAPGTSLGLGSHPITLTATDDAGNSSSCTFTVNVVDTTPPSISCPPNQTRSADASCQYTLEDFTGLATVSDNCDPSVTVTQSPAPGTSLGLGSHPITLTATDDAGNSSSCTFTVNVVDTTPPSISCPPNQTRSADASCQYTLEDFTGLATVSDNCDPSVTVTQSPAPGTSLGLGLHPITLTATDDAGNSSSCTFFVTVIPRKAQVTLTLQGVPGNLAPMTRCVEFRFGGTGGPNPPIIKQRNVTFLNVGGLAQATVDFFFDNGVDEDSLPCVPGAEPTRCGRKTRCILWGTKVL